MIKEEKKDIGAIEEEISIEDIIEIISNHFLLIIILPLVLGVSIYIGSKLMPPTYRASSQVLVDISNRQTDPQQLYVQPEPLDISTYKEVALSKSIISKIYDIGLNAAQLQEIQNRLSVKSTEGRYSGILRLSVEHNDPIVASTEANSWAESLISWEKNRSLGTLDNEKKLLAAQLKAADHQLKTLDPNIDPDRYNSLVLLKASLQRKLDQIDILEAGIRNRLHLLEPAEAPIHPIKPRPIFNAVIAAIFGLFIAIITALLLELMSTRIRNSEEAAAITNLPILAEFPKLPMGNSSTLPKETALFLKTSLIPLLMGEETSIIAVSSTVSGEGKTSISLTLAQSFAHEGKKTLLVDADLRKPDLGNRLPIPPGTPGLKQAMEYFEDASFSLSDNLDVLPCVSPPNDPNDFISKHFKSWIKYVVDSKKYRYVIIDTAPLLPVPDTLIIAPHVSGLLLVAAERKTTKKALNTVIRVLGHLGIKPYGLVMNFVKNPSTVFVGGYGDYHYGTKYGKVPLSSNIDN